MIQLQNSRIRVVTVNNELQFEHSAVAALQLQTNYMQFVGQYNVNMFALVL